MCKLITPSAEPPSRVTRGLLAWDPRLSFSAAPPWPPAIHDLRLTIATLRSYEGSVGSLQGLLVSSESGMTGLTGSEGGSHSSETSPHCSTTFLSETDPGMWLVARLESVARGTTATFHKRSRTWLDGKRSKIVSFEDPSYPSARACLGNKCRLAAAIVPHPRDLKRGFAASFAACIVREHPIPPS